MKNIYTKTKIKITDLFDIAISFFKLNKNRIYKEFVIQSSISQIIRGKTHNKRDISSYIKIIGKYVYLIFRLLKFNRRIIQFKPKLDIQENFDLLIVYPNNDKWILRGLSKDLEREIKNLNLSVKACEMRNIYKYKTKHVFFSHQALAIRLIRKNPIFSDISSTYISHLRSISNSEIEIFNKFQNIFCQSEKDKMRLNSFGFLPGRVLYLPIGYDDDLFYKYKFFKNRKYDFVISFPLKTNSLGSHYWLRKSSVLLHETIIKLAHNGYKILILGEGWDKSLLSNNSNIEIEKVVYSKKNKLLNDAKIFLNLSLLEGGPVTMIEAIAAGCKIITKDNGIAYNLSLDFPEMCFKINNIISASDLSRKIIEIYNKENNDIKNDYSKTLKGKYSFKSLSRKIIKNIEI